MQGPHNTTVWRVVPVVVISYLLVLGGGSRLQAEVLLSCSQFAATHCGGAPVMTDTRVTGGSATVPSCTINIAADVPLKFKNPGNPPPCLDVAGEVVINGTSNSSLRIEHTTIEASALTLDFEGAASIHVEDSALSATTTLTIYSGNARVPGSSLIVVEDSVLEATEITIASNSLGSEVTLKGAALSTTGSIRILSFGGASAVKVKEGSTLEADTIEMTTAPGALLAVTGSTLTADSTVLGFDGGGADAVDNIKANTFVGGEVTIACPARVTGNTFTLSGDLEITGSSPCTCSKNTPNVVCPTP